MDAPAPRAARAAGLRPPSPTVLLPLGPAAARVVGALGVSDGSLAEVVTPDADVAAALEPALQRLLRAGTHAGLSPRLDLVLIVDAREGLPEALPATVRAVTGLVDARYSAIFTPGASADQRSHGLHVIVLAPALVAHGPGRAVLAGLGALLAEPQAAHVARVWLLAAQTAAGVLTEDDQISAAAAFVGSLFGEGLRDAEAARARLAPYERKVGMVSVARLDLPMTALATWVQVRSAWEALDALVRRTHAAPRGSASLPDGLDVPRLLEPLTTGATAQRLRHAPPGTPEQRAALEELHRAEIAAHATASAAAEGLLRGELTARHRLDLVPDVIAALSALIEAQRRAIAEEEAAQRATRAEPLVPQATPQLPAAPPPSPVHTALLLGPSGLALGLALGARLGLPAAAPSSMLSSTVVTTAAPSGGGGLGAPMAAGGLAGLLLALVITWWLTRAPSEEAPPPATAEAPRGDAGPPLALARARVRRAVIQVATVARERLETARTALREARDALRQEVDTLRARPGDRPAQDDLEPLLGPEAPLHAHLLPAPEVARWLDRSRSFTEPDVWADQLLAALWPKTGLVDDAPGADLAAARAAGLLQLAAFNEHTLFDDEQSSARIAARFAAFLPRAAQALAPATTPRGPHGDPVQGLRPGEILVVAPEIARPVIEETLRRAEVPIAALAWSPDPSPRVVILRTWEGHTIDEIARGAGLGGAA